MTDLLMWSLIVGFFMPPVQAVIQQSTWSTELRAGANLVLCAVAAVGVVYFEGDFTGRRFIQSALIVGVTAIAFYKGTWKPTGIAPAIESATSPSTTAQPR